MSRKLNWIAVALCLSLTSAAFSQSLGNDSKKKYSDDIVDVVATDEFGGEVPFPSSALAFFPWSQVEGVWGDVTNALGGVFKFAASSDPHHRILKVTYADKNTGLIVATGVGYASEDQKVVRAYLRSTSGTFGLILRSYDLNEVGYNKSEMVLTVEPSDGNMNGSDGQHFIMRKMGAAIGNVRW